MVKPGSNAEITSSAENTEEKEENDLLKQITEITRGSAFLSELIKISEQRKPAPANEAIYGGNSLEARLRKIYDQGFEKVMCNIPFDPGQAPDTYEKSLAALKSFKRDEVAWCEIRGETIYSLQRCYKEGGFMAVMPPNSEYAKTQQSVIFVTPQFGPKLLSIRPDNMTEIWAGIISVFGLSSLMSKVTKSEPEHPNKTQYLAAQVLADQMEIMVANSYTQRQLMKAMYEFIGKYRFQTLDEGIRWQLDQQNMLEIVKNLDPLITKAKPKSAAERRMRISFYSKTFVFALVHMLYRGASRQMLLQKQMEVAEKMAVIHGYGNYIPDR